jgi:hypothetical protein
MTLLASISILVPIGSCLGIDAPCASEAAA